METIAEAKQYLKRELLNGAVCPCCDKHVQAYKYKLTSSTAAQLCMLYWMTKDNPTQFIHVENELVERGIKIKGTIGKAKYFYLVRQMPNKDFTKHKSGYWQLTNIGRDFVEGNHSIEQYLVIYNDKIIGRGPIDTTITDALATKFNYRQLMSGVWE